MVFSGRTRGRGFGAKGGGIHATTRKSSSSVDRSRYRDHEHSMSPPRKRPTSVEDRLGAKYPDESPAPQAESLRITVGNDIFNKGSVGSPLSDRLGPPVQQYQNPDSIFEQERMYYGGGGSEEKREDKYRRDSPSRRYQSDSRGRRDDRDRDRRRDSSRERRDRRGSGRDHHDGGHDRRDNRRDSRDYRDRREESRERHHSSSYSSHYDRRDEPLDRDYRDPYKGELDKKYDERFSMERLDPQYEDRLRRESDIYDDLSRERSQEGQNPPGNFYGRGSFESLTQPGTQSGWRSPPKSEPTPPTAKPLKSILKKKTDNVAPPVVQPTEMGGGSFGLPVESRLGPQLGQEYNSGRPSLGHSMDIEDEERFLYGEPEKKEIPPPSSQPPPWSQPFVGDHFQPQTGGRQQNNTFPILSQRQSHSPPPAYIPEEPLESERQYDSSDLLSIFTKRPQPRVMEETRPPPAQPQPTQPPPMQQPTSFAESVSQEVKQQKYDPTIENILKSIGFDFEMSKRMQEKAGSEPKKEELPQQYGINQTASFLGGGLSTEEIGLNLFPKKKPSVETSSSLEDRDKGNERAPYDGRQKESFVDQVLRKDAFSKRDLYPPPPESSTPQPPVTYVSSYAPYLQGYAAPTYTGSFMPTQSEAAIYSAPPVVDPYRYPPEYSMAQSQHAPPERAYTAERAYSAERTYSAESQRDASISQVSPGLPKAPEKSVRENLTTITLEENLPKPQKSEPLSKKKNARPNLREIPKSSEPIRRIPETQTKYDKSPVSTNRTVLPPKSESAKMPPQGTKRPAEKEMDQSLINKKRQAEKLLKDKEERQKRIQALEEELRKLRRQQNEIMRKKRRQKDGHKDPILLQNSKLQEEIAMQISKLRKLSEGKSPEEIQPQQKKIKVEKEPEKVKEDVEMAEGSESKDRSGTPAIKEEVPAPAVVKQEVKPETAVKQEEKPKQMSFQVKGAQKTKYEFFDPGKHWCKLCNTVYDTATLFLEHTHLRHNKKWKNTDTYDRPWIPDQMKNPPQKKKGQKVEVVALKGPEFLFPTNGFYCVLCREFSGDVQCADFHLKTETHLSNYQKFLVDSPFYEQRRQLDRAKGLAEKQEKNLKEKGSRPLFGRNPSKEKEIKSTEKAPSINIEQSEKEVEELSDVQSNSQSSAAKIAKVKLSLKKPPIANPTPKPEPEPLPTKMETEAPPTLQTQNSVEEAEKKANGEKKEDGKKGIEIKIANKIGIVGKVPAKKNALLPPWTPVTRQDPLKAVPAAEAEKNKSAMEKKQVTAQDILKALQEKKEQERKEMEEKAKEEALRNVMEIPVPEMPSKDEEEKPGVRQDTKPDLSSIQIPIPETPSKEEVEKPRVTQNSKPDLSSKDIPVPEMTSKNEEKPGDTQSATADLGSVQIPVPVIQSKKEEKPGLTQNIKPDLCSTEIPSKKEDKPGVRQDTIPDLSSIPVPSPQKPENSIISEDKNVESDKGQETCDVNINNSKENLENIVMPESGPTTLEKDQKIQTDSCPETRQEETVKGPSELSLDKNKTLGAEISASGTVHNVQEAGGSQEKESLAEVSRKSQKDNQTSIAEVSTSHTAVEVTQIISISENAGDDTEKEDLNQGPQTCESEDAANDVDDDKTIIDDEDTMDNNDVLEISDDDTRDGEDNETTAVSQQSRCRPIEDVIEISMGSLGDVVEVAVGGETDQDLEGDIECDVDQLYGVIGGESENLDDVLSVGQDRGGAGCFSELGVKPMDVEDTTDGGGMNDEEVGNIVDELMHSNGIESGLKEWMSNFDQESVLSGTMGSDFEIVDECDEDT
ncbi:zinc finger protein 318-like [Saccostrea echinata]|uniref:zinc finger protein 318-like n=1 Tax=Saccostrea echinata TaxID=191078 RepID=UPI002A8124E7|nr:zinc finger protein 318-like [Saccostrea echinata]